MVMKKVTAAGSAILKAGSWNQMENNHMKETDRNSGFNSGSFTNFRDGDNFIVSGAAWDITNGSSYTSTFYRDDGFIISGTESRLGKTIDFTYFRDADNFIISGVNEVS